MLPLLEGDIAAAPRNRFFYYYSGELRAIREGKWKRVFEHRTRSYVGVEPGNDGYPGPYAFLTVPAALYDLEDDPGETRAFPQARSRHSSPRRSTSCRR